MSFTISPFLIESPVWGTPSPVRLQSITARFFQLLATANFDVVGHFRCFGAATSEEEAGVCVALCGKNAQWVKITSFKTNGLFCLVGLNMFPLPAQSNNEWPNNFFETLTPSIETVAHYHETWVSLMTGFAIEMVTTILLFREKTIRVRPVPCSTFQANAAVAVPCEKSLKHSFLGRHRQSKLIPSKSS